MALPTLERHVGGLVITTCLYHFSENIHITTQQYEKHFFPTTFYCCDVLPYTQEADNFRKDIFYRPPPEDISFKMCRLYNLLSCSIAINVNTVCGPNRK